MTGVPRAPGFPCTLCFREGVVDEKLRALSAPRDRDVVSSRQPRKKRTTDIGWNAPARLCLPLCRFAQDAQTDNLPSLDDGILLKMRGAFEGQWYSALAFLI